MKNQVTKVTKEVKEVHYLAFYFQIAAFAILILKSSLVCITPNRQELNLLQDKGEAKSHKEFVLNELRGDLMERISSQGQKEL